MTVCPPSAPPPAGCGGDPSSWIVRFAPLVTAGGAVLDVACGGGRHLRHFHRLGHPVTGIDRDTGGLADLHAHEGVTIVTADLEDGSAWPLPHDARFAAVVVTHYLHRPLFPRLLDAVAPGGVLLYETFASGNERYGRPSRPDFLLQPGELIQRVAGRLTVVAYEHGLIPGPRSAVIQRLAAVAPPGEPRLFIGHLP